MRMVAKLSKFSSKVADELKQQPTPGTISHTWDALHQAAQVFAASPNSSDEIEALELEVQVYLQRIFGKPQPHSPNLAETNTMFWDLYRLITLNTAYRLLRMGGIQLTESLEFPERFDDRLYNAYDYGPEIQKFFTMYQSSQTALQSNGIAMRKLSLADLEKRLRMNRRRSTVIIEGDKTTPDFSSFPRNVSVRGFMQMKAKDYDPNDTKRYPLTIGTQVLSLQKGLGAKEVHIETLGMEENVSHLRKQSAFMMAKCILDEKWNSQRAVVLALKDNP